MPVILISGHTLLVNLNLELKNVFFWVIPQLLKDTFVLIFKLNSFTLLDMSFSMNQNFLSPCSLILFSHHLLLLFFLIPFGSQINYIYTPQIALPCLVLIHHHHHLLLRQFLPPFPRLYLFLWIHKPLLIQHHLLLFPLLLIHLIQTFHLCYLHLHLYLSPHNCYLL